MKTKRIIAAAVLIVGSGLALPRTRWCIFVDAHGRIRYHQLGEGACDQAEHVIQHLLTEAGAGSVPNDLVSAVAAVSAFPEEFYQAPRSWTEKAYPKLIYYNKLDKGGHFAAWEQPQLLVTDLRAAFKSLR